MHPKGYLMATMFMLHNPVKTNKKMGPKDQIIQRAEANKMK